MADGSEIDHSWETAVELYDLPSSGTVQGVMNNYTEDMDVPDAELSEAYEDLIRQELSNPRHKPEAYLAAFYRDIERVGQRKAGEIFGVNPVTIRRAERELEFKRSKGNSLMEIEGSFSEYMKENGDEDVAAAEEYVRNTPEARVRETKKALDARRLGKALGIDEVGKLIDPVKDSDYGDLAEIQRALQSIDDKTN